MLSSVLEKLWSVDERKDLRDDTACSPRPRKRCSAPRLEAKLSLQVTRFREVSMSMSLATPNAERQTPNAERFVVRAYQPFDREAVRDLCCRTGFLGKPIDPVFEDRELFADFLTDYYLTCEPDSAFVVTIDKAVEGYLLGCRFPRRHQIFSVRQAVSLGAKALFRLARYKAESRRYIRWIALNAWREVPDAPRHVGHFHMNFLPELKRIAVFRAVLEHYLRFLADNRVKQISAQMVTFDERRTLNLFERYGFRVLNRSRISKFKRFTSEPVYLSTIIKDIIERDGRVLYQVAPGAHRANSGSHTDAH